MPFPEIESFVTRSNLDEQSALELQEIVQRIRDHDQGLTIIQPGRRQVVLEGSTGLPFPADLLTGGVASLPSRFEDLGLLGSGGTAEVRRVRDRELNAILAMKLLRKELLQYKAARSRFLDEAQCCSQLQHPNIVPVHDIGSLPDGRLWFTMREVQGRTLASLIKDVHRNEESSTSGWTHRRLVQTLLVVAEAVGYAHARGVVHRDLKPNNIMVGNYGEIYVLDWGLAKVAGYPDNSTTTRGLKPIQTANKGSQTRVGSVWGTPPYMAPEQANGHIVKIDARTDIYALGAILYEILSGMPPYLAKTSNVLEAVRAGPPDTLEATTFTSGFHKGIPRGGDGPFPKELVDAMTQAMARDQAKRFPTAEDFAAEMRAWLDGVRRRDQARMGIARAEELEQEVATLRRCASQLRSEGEALIRGLEAWRPEGLKRAGWAKQDDALTIERVSVVKELESDQALYSALRMAPGLQEVHALLAQRFRSRHAAAENARNEDEASIAEVQLRQHVSELRDDHPVARACTTYLAGEGALTLVTDPAGAEVRLHRYVVQNRRLRPVFEASLGVTPLREMPLPMGSYLCTISHPGRVPVSYPIQIARGQHWAGVRPGGHEPHPIWLPKPSISVGTMYIPAGWFWAGGDKQAQSPRPLQRLWCDAFFIDQFPVTNHRYLIFLNDLVERGCEQQALRLAPRERAGTTHAPGAMIYGRDENGRFVLEADADGDVWLPDYPVCMIDWDGAYSYMRWQRERTGHPWRLPALLEREKAGRGVDGRFYPWGDFLDPTWCCIATSHPGPRRPAVVDSYPADVSPYGVRGMAGNMAGWCANDVPSRETATANDIVIPRQGEPGGQAYLLSGCGWNETANLARLADSRRSQRWVRNPNIGLRGVYSASDGG